MDAFLNPDSTFAEQADRVLALYRRIGEVRDDHGHDEDDARHVCLNNIMMAANASVSTLRLLHWAKQGGDGVLSQALIGCQTRTISISLPKICCVPVAFISWLSLSFKWRRSFVTSCLSSRSTLASRDFIRSPLSS